MDDVLVLTPTRGKLRQAVRVVNRTFAALDLEKAPNKTFIGRVEKDFDFLGYHVSPHGLTVSEQTCQRFIERWRRLYEQAPRTPQGSLGVAPTFGGGGPGVGPGGPDPTGGGCLTPRKQPLPVQGVAFGSVNIGWRCWAR